MNKYIPSLKNGKERIIFEGQEMSLELLDFWRWSSSDLLSNASRGIFAEFIVAMALHIPLNEPRAEWSVYDLRTPEGINIEVKSSAFLQSWYKGKLSIPSFDIRPTKMVDADGTILDSSYVRRADVYVFCFFKHQEIRTVNPLNLDQWEFFVISTRELNDKKANQKRISLNSLRKLCGDSIAFHKIHRQVIKVNQPM